MKTYNEVRNLYLLNPTAFRVGLTTLIQIGANALQSDSITTDVFPGNVMTEDFKETCLAVAKNLSELPLNVLLAFIQRDLQPEQGDSIPPLHPFGDENNICPLCDAEIECENPVLREDEAGATIRWSCPDCGATGTAAYSLTFRRHFTVRDRDQRPIEGRPE